MSFLCLRGASSPSTPRPPRSVFLYTKEEDFLTESVWVRFRSRSDRTEKDETLEVEYRAGKTRSQRTHNTDLVSTTPVPKESQSVGGAYGRNGRQTPSQTGGR